MSMKPPMGNNKPIAGVVNNPKEVAEHTKIANTVSQCWPKENKQPANLEAPDTKKT